MKQKEIPRLGILQYSVLHVLSLISTFLKGGIIPYANMQHADARA